MNTIDDLIVAMGFDNRQFESAVRVSMATLDALKKNLQFDGQGSGFAAVGSEAETNSSALIVMGSALDEVQAKFSVLGAIGFSVINKLTDSIMSMATNAIRGGWSGGLDRALKIEQARFQFKGLGQDVEASMDSALAAVKGTSFGLDAAASVASQFGATGMSAGKEMTEALRGVAGMAAMTGKSYEEIGSIFTTVAGQGKLTTMRMQQFATRGVNVAAQLAKSMNKTEEEIRKMVTNGEIDFKTFAAEMNKAFGEHATKANETYAGSVANMNAALSRIGASFHTPRLEAMRKIFNGLTPVIDDIADGLKPLVEDFTKFSEIKADKIVSLLEKVDLSKMSNVVSSVSKGIFNIANTFSRVLGIAGSAFKEIFQGTGIQGFADSFRALTERLQFGSETAENLKRTFKGVFAIFSIVGTIIGHIIGTLAKLFGVVASGSGGFFSLTASVGDWLVAIDRALKEGSFLSSFFGALGAILAVPIKLFQVFVGAAANLAQALGNLGLAAAVVWGILAQGDFKGGLWEEDSRIVDVLFRIRGALVIVGGALSQFWNILARGDFVGGGPFEEDSPLVSALFRFRDMLKNFFSPGNISTLLGAGAIAALGYGFVRVFKKAIAKITGNDSGIMSDLKDAVGSMKSAFGNISDLFGTLTSSLKVMQTDIKANIILKIAIAVGILAMAMKLLSTLDAAGLAKSLAGVTGAMTTLVGALAVISKIAGLPGIVNMPIIAASLVLLAGSILILSLAMKVMASMSWEEIAKGLVSMAGALALLIAASYGLSKINGPLLRTGLAMIPLAIGLRILASALRAMGDMSWEEIGKGMATLASSILVLSVGLRLLPKNMLAIGAGLLMVGIGISAMSVAIRAMGGMDVATTVQGIAGIGGALVVIGIGMRMMPKGMPAMAVGLLGVSIALNAVAGAVRAMGSMSWSEMGKGLAGLAGSLIILGIALNAMSGSIMGAVALTVAAAGLSLLMIPLMMMASMSWQEVLTGLGMLAGVLTILGVAGYVLTPVVPVIIAIGIALGLMGIGLLAVGAAALVFGMALMTLLQVVMMGQEAMISLLTFIPRLAQAFGDAIASFLVSIANNAGEIAGAFAKLLGSLLDAITGLIPKIGALVSALITTILDLIIEHTPEIGEAFRVMLQEFLTTITTMAPAIWNAGFDLIIGFLEVIRDRVPEMANTATDIIVAFIDTIANNTNRVVQAGMQMIIDFLHGLANAIRVNMPEVIGAAREVGDAIIDGIANALRAGVGRLVSAARDTAMAPLRAARSVLGIKSPSKEFFKIGEFVVDGFVNGIRSKDTYVSKTANKFATGFVAGFSKGIGKEMPKVMDEFFKILKEGTENAVISTRAMRDGFNSLSGAVWQAELAMAEFHGEVNRADPKSVEEYVEKTGGRLKYLTGVIDGVSDAAKEMFGQLADGKSLDKVLGSEEFLSGVLNAGLSIGSMFGIEGMLIAAGVRLGLAVGDGLLAIFMGPGNTILGTLGGWITKLVRAVGGWIGVTFPVDEEISEGDKALEDFMARVDDGHGRFEKLTEEAVKSLTDELNEADDLSKGIDGMNPTVAPILDLNGWNKSINDWLESLDTGPVVLNGIINKLFGNSSFIDDTVGNLRNLLAPRAIPSPVNNNVTFNQTNTSPTSLSPVEIYKNTKSQLALAREELSLK